MNKTLKKRSSEHGGAGIKFLSFVFVVILMANAGINFIPVAYNAEGFKQEMSTAVIQGIAIPGKKTAVEMIKERLNQVARSYDLPDDTFIEVKQTNNIPFAHVYYMKEVQILPFGLYNYQFEFDHTVTPSGFLTRQ